VKICEKQRKEADKFVYLGSMVGKNCKIQKKLNEFERLQNVILLRVYCEIRG
jgi:hypothetical protein